MGLVGLALIGRPILRTRDLDFEVNTHVKWA